MLDRLWNRMLPRRYQEQLVEAKDAVAAQREALETTAQREKEVNMVAWRLGADLRKNHYSIIIAQALGRS